MSLISAQEILMGRDAQFPLDDACKKNLAKLLTAVNRFRAFYGKPLVVSSGYRPGGFNKAAGGAKKSNHMVCLAVDFRDTDGAIDAYCMQHLDILEQCGLYLESPDHTPGWCHLQVVAPKSGKRVFLP